MIDLQIPNELFEQKIADLALGINGFHFYRSDELKKQQIGYRYNADFEKIEDWIGEEYLVIGYETLMEDPILVNTKEQKLPVYTMFRDDWNLIRKIADNFTSYRAILQLLRKTDFTIPEKVDDLLVQIKKMIGNSDFSYWEDLLWIIHEEINL